MDPLIKEATKLCGKIARIYYDKGGVNHLVDKHIGFIADIPYSERHISKKKMDNYIKEFNINMNYNYNFKLNNAWTQKL